MKLYDQHLHSANSVDSRSDPSEVVRAAIGAGLAGVTFTEHYDPHESEWDVCIYDYERIAQAVAVLREQYGDQIFIGHGIEVDYQRERMPYILDHLTSHRFDLVILAVHFFDGRALHHREHWGSLSPDAATRAYLATVLEAAQLALELDRRGQRPFDVLAHLDLVKRYTQRYFGCYDVASHQAAIDSILQTCLAANLIPELNCSSLRQSLPETLPADWAVRRYAELGGRAMTLGSDAHALEHVGAGLNEGAAILQQNAIKHQAIFMNRQRYDLPLEDEDREVGHASRG
ncbi:MAG: histidinol-phosphatase HisJ family protein [Phycisphaerae bacterium]|nr:histidinol-phosphatase HisJ family protein [Phycisphaerae bacterium]